MKSAYKRNALWVTVGVLVVIGAGAILYIKNREVNIPEDWKTYQSEKFGIRFWYPGNAVICDMPLSLGSDNSLDIVISMGGECKRSDQYGLLSGDIFIHADNAMVGTAQAGSNENLRDDFYKDFGGIDRSLNPDLRYIDIDGIRAYGGIVRRTKKGSAEYITLINQGGNYISIWDRHYDSHQQETDMLMNSLYLDFSGNSREEQKRDAILPDIAAPAGWYMHRISKANILFTKEEQLPNIGNTETFAYGRQINVSIVNANGSAEGWIEERTQPDVLIRSKKWEVVNGGKVLKVEMNGEADKSLMYYVPRGDIVYEYMLYPSEIYDPATKMYIQDEEGIKTIQTMIWQLRKEQ